MDEWSTSYEVPAGVSLSGLLRWRIAQQPNEPAVHIDGGWLTFTELGRLIFSTAAVLRGAGVVAGLRVGTLLPNGRAYLGAWLGCAELGATLVPINNNLTGETLRYIVEHAQLDVLIVGADASAALEAAFGDAKPARMLFSVGGELAGAASFEALLDARAAPPPLLEQATDAPALIIYTSGTTGRPKGVVLSRAAQLAHGWYYGKDFVRLQAGERSYTCLPLFHVTSMGFTLGTLLGGAAVAIDPTFSAFAFWRRIRTFDARIFPYLGAMIGMLAARPPRADDASVPVLRAVGAATPVGLWEAFERRFGLSLIETYGQTELASLWLMPPAQGGRVGSVGLPAPRFEARIAGAAGGPAAAGTVGELLVRPHDRQLMFQEYVRDPAATARAFRDGWYATGDAASQDADGFFRFEGRLKDFIRRRGENISAFEVERQALTYPSVKEAAAIGLPSPLGEEDLKLCVLPHAGATIEPAALYRHLRQRLADFMLPRFIEVYSEFPRTATQRVQKFRLVEDGLQLHTWDRHHAGTGRA